MVNSLSKCLTEETTAGIPAGVVLGTPIFIFSSSMGGVGILVFHYFILTFSDVETNHFHPH